MENINRINFDNVRVNDFIEYKNNFLKNDIRIYKVTAVDEKTYNAGKNEYYKLVQCELISVLNGDINIYKNAGLIKDSIIFYEHNYQYLTFEGYKLI